MCFLTYRTFFSLIIVIIIIYFLVDFNDAHSHTYTRLTQFHNLSPISKGLPNVQPEITDLPILLELNVTVPNCWCWQLVIPVIVDYALSHVDSRTALSRVFLIQHDHDVHKATRPAMFPVIICHRWLGLSRNCRESKLSRERAKKKKQKVNNKLRTIVNDSKAL